MSSIKMILGLSVIACPGRREFTETRLHRASSGTHSWTLQAPRNKSRDGTISFGGSNGLGEHKVRPLASLSEFLSEVLNDS